MYKSTVCYISNVQDLKRPRSSPAFVTLSSISSIESNASVQKDGIRVALRVSVFHSCANEHDKRSTVCHTYKCLCLSLYKQNISYTLKIPPQNAAMQSHLKQAKTPFCGFNRLNNESVSGPEDGFQSAHISEISRFLCCSKGFLAAPLF